MMRSLSLATQTHGKVLVDDPTVDPARGVLVGFHGYGQNAEAMLEEMRRIPGVDPWRLVSVQALHRFYTRNDQSVVASWMTREDRDLAIADNIEYVNRVVDKIRQSTIPNPEPRVVFLGFSQGASMAARAAVRGSHRSAGLVMLGGDIPADVREAADSAWPRVLIGCGARDTWYGARVDSDVEFLQSRGVAHELVRFDGGHEFTDEFRQRVGSWLSSSFTLEA